MSKKTAPKDLSRNIFLFYTEDGLIDLAIGLVLFGFGGLLFLKQPGFIGVLGLLTVGLWYLGKRCISMPRIGIIRLQESARHRLTGFFITMIILGSGVLATLLTRSGDLKSGNLPLILFALVLALGISALGLILKVHRLYIYAILVFSVFSGGNIFNRAVGGTDIFILSVMGTGLIILAAGTVVLSRFLRKYPKVTEETA